MQIWQQEAAPLSSTNQPRANRPTFRTLGQPILTEGKPEVVRLLLGQDFTLTVPPDSFAAEGNLFLST